MSNNTRLIYLFFKAQKIDKSSEQGYAMALVSMLTIVMFSLLAAGLSFSNLAKSRTNAVVDGNSAFYVAEAGLNKRAAEIDKKLKSYVLEGSPNSTGIRGLANCFGLGIPSGGAGESTRSGNNDFECVNYRFQSTNNSTTVGAGGNIMLDSRGQDRNTYVAYTLVADRTNYVGGVAPYQRLTTGDFAGLNAAVYKYEVYSTGKKPVALQQVATVPVYTDEQIAAKNRQTTSAPAESGDPALIAAYDSITSQAAADSTAATRAAQDSSNNTTLSMTFTNRVIPLFQFGIFYNGDLELNSTADLQIDGRVHSNANMYLQPAGLIGAATPPIATFVSNVSAAGSIYNRVDAWTEGVGRTGITRVLLTGATFENIPAYSSSNQNPLTATEINAFTNNTLRDSAAVLKTPPTGFTRKRNYANNKIGEYFSKADMRLEMVPDRDVTAKSTTAPWTRNNSIIPFNFTAITTSGTGTCTTASPATGSDPAANYVAPDRDRVGSLRCRTFNKGQLQSLRQPVMVLTSINQNRSNTAFTTAQFREWEGRTLGAPTTFSSGVPLGSLSTSASTTAAKTKIIRALQVAIASTPKPIRFERLNDTFNSGTGIYATNTASESLQTFRETFSTIINNISELDNDDRDKLMRSSPNEIAALMNAWFLPAPIQRIERPTADTVDATSNPRGSGFYDGREERWITMLQTNIASLSVWNRDGLFVKASDETMTSAYAATTTDIDAAFNAGAGANFTSGLAFDRVTTFTKTDGSEIYPITGWQYLGLGGSDITEGGLAVHATVNDDLDGSGGTLVAANDVTIVTTNSQRILKKDRNNNNELDDSGNVIVLDYYRTYPGQTASKQSPFAFAFNGGDYLPNAMMLASDQSIYVQGNFNNNNNGGVAMSPTAANTPSAARLPAAIVADTITVLSNQCLAGVGANPLNVPSRQLSCGFPTRIDGVAQLYNSVASAIAINAAFLSNTQVSRGNLGTDRGFGLAASAKSYSGGANNYIRLLEDWYNNGTPYALNYSGSLISLGEPIEYGGLYRAGGRDTTNAADTAYYNVPFRNINYDTFFNSIAKLPPLTPKVSYAQQNSFGRTYDLR